jgi:glycosyltransferase involved in cell wall biosynthesis
MSEVIGSGASAVTLSHSATRASTTLSVALCTHNHKDRLQRTLRDLAQLVRPDSSWELLIVDNASTDGTSQLAAATDWRTPDLKVRVVREEQLGLSNARNRAIREATGDYIIFMDDDETPDPQWLSAYERVILAERPDALGGRIEVMFEDGERPAWLQDELLGFLGRLDHGGVARRLVDPGTPIFGGNFGFRRDVFARVGSFDAALGRKGTANIGGEDTELYRRMIAMGCHVWWAPQAVIHHRIQAGKLRRRYFLDLHFRQGRVEGLRKRGDASRIPRAYLIPQLWRAAKAALTQRFAQGADTSLRKEMNIAYFLGYIIGWVVD